MAAHPSYVARIHRVVDHIDAHLDAPLDLATLAGIAHFSPWHFHRLFQAMTGETLAARVRRRRLERAAARLLATPPAPVLVVAIDVGFASAAVFTRAFSAHFGMTPTAWRRGGWEAWVAGRRLQLRKIHQGERKPSEALAAAFRDDSLSWQARHASASKGNEMNVEIKTLADTRVAYMRHTGPYGSPGIAQTWQRFAAWCAEQGLFDGRHAAIGISQDNPDITAPSQLRYDACIAVDAGFVGRGDIGMQTVSGGRYACTPFHGTGADIHAAWMRFYGEWLPNSGWQADDRPALELYGTAMQVDAKTGAITCDLAIPVRAA